MYEKELLDAATNGDIQKFIELFPKADISCTDADGNNALHLAALNAKLKIVQYIVQHKPSLINKKNHSHNTPLHLATAGGSKEIVSLLLENHAEEQAQNKAGFNFFLFAFYGCETSLTMLDYLLSLHDDIVSRKEKQTVVGDYHFETLYQKLKKIAGQEKELKKTQEKLKLASSKSMEESTFKEDIIFAKLYNERELQRSEILTGSNSYFLGFRTEAGKHERAKHPEPIPVGKEKEELQQAKLMSAQAFAEIPRLADLMFEKLKSRKKHDFEHDEAGYSRAEEQIRRYLQFKEDHSIKENDYVSIIVEAIKEEAHQELKKEMEAEMLSLKEGQKLNTSQFQSLSLGVEVGVDDEPRKNGTNGTKGSILRLQLQHQESRKLRNVHRTEAPVAVEANGYEDGLEGKEPAKKAGKFS